MVARLFSRFEPRGLGLGWALLMFSGVLAFSFRGVAWGLRGTVGLRLMEGLSVRLKETQRVSLALGRGIVALGLINLASLPAYSFTPTAFISMGLALSLRV